jgi:hypothetical protein
MIKFNEVTWYSKLAAVIFFLAVLPILTFYIGMEYEKTEEAMMPPSVVTSSPTVTNTSGYELLTYTNAKYGWSFKYPSTWKVTENKDGTSVSVDSSARAASLNPESKATFPKFTLNFSTVKKTDFGTVNSKWGIITFDLKKNALVADSCLPVSTRIGVKQGEALFQYTGSLMSTPAYSGSAIVTDKDYLVIVSSEMYDSIDDTLAEGAGIIYATFQLAPEVYSIIPQCAQ